MTTQVDPTKVRCTKSCPKCLIGTCQGHEGNAYDHTCDTCGETWSELQGAQPPFASGTMSAAERNCVGLD